MKKRTVFLLACLLVGTVCLLNYHTQQAYERCVEKRKGSTLPDRKPCEAILTEGE